MLPRTATRIYLTIKPRMLSGANSTVQGTSVFVLQVTSDLIYEGKLCDCVLYSCSLWDSVNVKIPCKDHPVMWLYYCIIKIK